jgi:hypothetical protein
MGIAGITFLRSHAQMTSGAGGSQSMVTCSASPGKSLEMVGLRLHRARHSG